MVVYDLAPVARELFAIGLSVAIWTVFYVIYHRLSENERIDRENREKE